MTDLLCMGLVLWGLAIALVCAVVWRAIFSYVTHDQGRKVEAWKVYRPEGRPIQYTLGRPWRVLWYARKYRKKNFETSDELLAHFNAQRRLVARLAEQPLRSESTPHAAHLAIVGDLMWVRTNWDNFLHPDVKGYLQQFDAVLGNLETPIDRSTPPEEWYKVDCARFNSDTKLLTAFHDERKGRNIFTALSYANNHVFDRDDSGAIDTLRVLEELGIQQTGLHHSPEESKPVYFERNGIRFGFYATCYGYNDPFKATTLHLNTLPGLAPSPSDPDSIDMTPLLSAVEEMESAGAEFKILSVHWGHEFELYPTDVQVELGRRFAALGFDLIAGTHSHVVQPSEVCFVNGYEHQLPDEVRKLVCSDANLSLSCIAGRGAPRKALIHYSLGNFITAMLFWEPKFGVIQSIEVFRSACSGRVDWHLPRAEFVYNALAIHNRGAKELHLLRSYFQREQQRIEESFPRNRAAAAYLVRHLHEEMTMNEVRRGPHDDDYRAVTERIRFTVEEV